MTPEASSAPIAGLPASAWIKILVLGVLFSAMNFWQFDWLFQKWRDDANWSHGFLIPLFSLYLLYVRRDEWMAAPRKTSLAGLPVVLLGIVLVVAGFWPFQRYYYSQLSMIILLLGLVWYVAGMSVMRLTWVPIVYLVLAMPIPGLAYEQIALPLQRLAAYCSGVILKLCGADVEVSALQLSITSRTGVAYPPLMVAEACSGVRSLMAFVALSVAMAYFDYRPTWHRVVLILFGVPIAVVCNIIRVTLTATMYVVDRPQLGTDVMHVFMGMVLLVPAFLLLLGLDRLLGSLFVTVEEPDAPSDAAAPPPPGGAP